MDAYVVSYIFILIIQQNYGIFILSIALAANCLATKFRQDMSPLPINIFHALSVSMDKSICKERDPGNEPR